MKLDNLTIIICCAGMGTRLGIGTTKALVHIIDKPLITYFLEELKEYSDIRIVVGYQSEKLINKVNSIRKDIMFAFNKDYKNNGPAASMWKALVNAKEKILILDGDMVFEPGVLKKIINEYDEFIGYSRIKSDEPLYLNIVNDTVVHFSNKETMYTWPGIIKINKDKISFGENYIYETIINSLPMKAVEINATEIDTQDDYERVINWINNDYK